MVEAAAHLRKGLDLLPALPETAERWRQELELQSALAAALVASKGNAAPETGRAYGRARELCGRLGDTAALVPVLSGLSTYHQTRAEYDAMRALAEDLLALGRRHGDTASSLVGHRSMGLCLHQLGDFEAAREHFEQVLRLYDAGAHPSLASIAAYDMRAVALSYLAWDLLLLGDPDRAGALGDQALSWTRDLGHPHTMAFALIYAVLLRLLRRDEPAAEHLVRELMALALEHRFPVWLGLARVMQGYVVAQRGEPAEGLALARKGWAEAIATGARWNRTFYLGLLARSCERAGQVDEAHELLGQALQAVEETGERWFEAELHRQKGEWLIAHRGGEIAEAEQSLRRAVAVAEAQKARFWHLRAATSLARLWRNHGEPGRARDLLDPLLGGPSAPPGLPDLHDAKALLETIA
jgi:predicted ATPase